MNADRVAADPSDGHQGYIEPKLATLQVDGRVATLTLNRPAKLNALSPALLADAVAEIELLRETGTGVLIVAGAGRAFSTGADLDALSGPAFSREDGRRFQALAVQLMHLLETIPQITIAKVHGLCLTGGLELALACDLIVAAEEAEFADTHAQIGFRPMWGLTQRLPRRIGIMRARELSFTGRRVKGTEAAALGLALEAVPAMSLDARVDALAAAIIDNNLDSLAAYKALYHQSQNLMLDEGLRYEAAARFRIARR
ncbi:MAG TPA: enoyl-CoA hydratase/isomerase family protein [Steroidobacteraceae bacterium]|jgi:enoyl-CoA hydratase/carnithine racemase